MARFSKRPEVSRHVERGLPDDAGRDLDDLLYQHKRREEEDEWDRKQEVKKFETVVSQTQYRKMVEHEANIRLLGFRWEDIDHSLVSLNLTDMA